MGCELLRTTLGRVAGYGLGLMGFVSLVLPRAADAQWVEAPGKGWISAEIYHHDTTKRYDHVGEKNDFLVGGHAKSSALFVTASVGLIENWDLWVRGSVNSLSYDDEGGERSTSGVGDANVWLRVAPLKYWGIDFPFAIRGGVKLPLGSSPVDAEKIPLSEGQTDWEIMAEIGHSFWPRSTYVNGWIGYRLREFDDEAVIDPGEEVFFLAQAGGKVGSFSYKLVFEGWDGAPSIIERLRIESSQRRYLQVTPSLWYETSLGSFEAGWRFPLDGRNLPAGGALVLGYFTRFGG